VRRCLVFAVWCVAPLFLVWALIPPLPPVWEGLELSRVVRDRSGGVLLFTRTCDDQFRASVRLEEIAPYVVEATLAYEDRFFLSASRRESGVAGALGGALCGDA